MVSFDGWTALGNSWEPVVLTIDHPTGHYHSEASRAISQAILCYTNDLRSPSVLTMPILSPIMVFRSFMTLTFLAGAAHSACF